jgi:hypothetical protein
MTATELAMKEARAAGWNPGPTDIPGRALILDREFWEALGRARGWSVETIELNWHRFIDALDTGRTVEEFFSSLS